MHQFGTSKKGAIPTIVVTFYYKAICDTIFKQNKEKEQFKYSLLKMSRTL